MREDSGAQHTGQRTGRDTGMSQALPDTLTRAEEALASGAWADARELFEASLDDDDPRAHDGLGRTMWWLGSADLAIEHRERAFAAYKAGGDTAKAAEIAIWLAREHLSVHGNDAVANGWLARARRLVGDAPSSARGRLDLALAKREEDSLAREELAERALATAHALGDADLEVAALAELGLIALQLGRVDDGLDRLDEAMAAATGGEADMLETVAEACCSLVAACDAAGDSGRLEQWARIVSGFIERRADLPLLGFCRTCNAQMLAASGRHEEAERELIASASELRGVGHRSRCVDPAVKLAEIRLGQGRFEEAASLLDGREGLPEATLPAAELYLARDDTSLAIFVLLRRLRVVGRDGLLGGPLLSALVEAHLAADDVDAARNAAADLDRIAAGSGHPLMGAYARLARGRIAAAQGASAADDLGAAADRLERFDRASEAARARLELAMVVQDHAVAVAEARRAMMTFERLGARRQADRAAALLRRLGERPATGSRDAETLTRREREVFALLGEGLTNAEIAARLFISTKTAGHHVSSLLAKLGLRNRQEAAALAIREARDRDRS
jgi:DNA-binding CsgD family transcriptional regulator